MSTFWHLAIESSGLGGSVALLHYDGRYQGGLHCQAVLPANRGSVQTLAPTIDQLLRDAQVKPAELASLSVTSGPGSFTGLRVGLATAKLLAWTAHVPVVPVDTLEAIALRFAQSTASHPGLMPDQYRLVTAINAFRKQVFTSSWRISSSDLQCQCPSSVVDADKWLADPWQSEQSETDTPLWISGGAIGSYAGLNPAHGCLADADLWQPLAEQVGCLGLTGLANGRAVSAEQLMPNYIRSSAAEENHPAARR